MGGYARHPDRRRPDPGSAGDHGQHRPGGRPQQLRPKLRLAPLPPHQRPVRAGLPQNPGSLPSPRQPGRPAIPAPHRPAAAPGPGQQPTAVAGASLQPPDATGVGSRTQPGAAARAGAGSGRPRRPGRIGPHLDRPHPTLPLRRLGGGGADPRNATPSARSRCAAPRQPGAAGGAGADQPPPHGCFAHRCFAHGSPAICQGGRR